MFRGDRRRKAEEGRDPNSTDRPISSSPTSVRHVLHRLIRKSPSKHSKQCTVATEEPSAQESEQTIEEEPPNENFLKTKVMHFADLPPQPEEEEKEDEHGCAPPTQMSTRCCAPEATAILQHSYLERICAASVDEILEESVYNQAKDKLPDDPTIQESIECVFASQLDEGLSLLDEDDNDTGIDNDLVAPSVLHQSFVKSRSEAGVNSEGNMKRVSSIFQRKTRKVHNKLVHVGTIGNNNFDDEMVEVDEEKPSFSEPLLVGEQIPEVECRCCRQTRPIVDPKRWPQRPLLLRPTPESGTRIKGIRFSGSDKYLWDANKDTNLTWPEKLRAHWEFLPTSDDSKDTMCSKCMVLPINNGNEKAGEALVTDFTTAVFEGTLLLRLRHSEGTTATPYDDNKGYFKGVNRRYQAVIQGKFLKAMPMIELTTGMEFTRKVGKLPPKWIVKGGLKVIKFFAPQLQTDFESDRPKSMSPLGSTPQSINVQDPDKVVAIDKNLKEPTVASEALLGVASDATATMQRARYRKKCFDKLYMENSRTPMVDTSKVYTFEFLQHLFNFQEFSVELGSMIGSVQLKESLDGQPLQFMATHGANRLWSFDIWHESIVDDAKVFDQQRMSSQCT